MAGALEQAMRYYPYVFHPITVVGGGTLLLVYDEWDRQDATRSTLWRRIAGFLGAGLLALVPTVAYFGVVGANPIQATVGNDWTMDALVAAGLFIGGATTWYLWRRFDWGSIVPGAMVALVAVTVPYSLLSPFWNISGHVIISLMPVLYVVLVARRYWPLLAVPVVMVPNRIVLDAHTWAQSIGGFLVAATITIGLYWRQNDRSLRPNPATTTLLD